MEIFAPGTFSREAEVSMKSLNINYFAWWNDRYATVLFSYTATHTLACRSYGSKSLPPVVPPSESGSSEIPLGVNALLKAIHKI